MNFKLVRIHYTIGQFFFVVVVVSVAYCNLVVHKSQNLEVNLPFVCVYHSKIM